MATDSELIKHKAHNYVPNYETFQHLTVAGEYGSSHGRLLHPTALSVQPTTGHIFVSDMPNSRIKIYSENLDYLKYFGLPHLRYPHGVLVHEESVYVTDLKLHAIFHFSLPKFSRLRRVGKKGSGNEDFNCPHQLDISPNQHIYVADCQNNRLQVLNSNLDFKNSLKHPTMTEPVDVKFSTIQIFVLSSTDNPCVHMFTYSGENIGSIITTGIGMQVLKSFFFCIDGQNNIIISDNQDCNIKVFSPEGRLLYIIGEYGNEPGRFMQTMGIAILNQTKLISLSLYNKFGIQLFSQF